MNRSRFFWRWLGLAGLMLFMAAPRAWACAACFGKSDSSMARGMNMGILSLLGVVVGMLSILTSFFVFLARKSSKAQDNTPGESAAIDSQHD